MPAAPGPLDDAFLADFGRDFDRAGLLLQRDAVSSNCRRGVNHGGIPWARR